MHLKVRYMDEEMLKKLDERLAEGEISEELYNEIISRYEKDDKDNDEVIEQIEETVEQATTKATKEEIPEKTERVSVSGASKIDGCNCEEFRASGASKVNGDLRADDADISGATKVDGNAYFGTLDSSGSLKIMGKSEGKKLDLSGASKFEDDIIVENIESSGSLKVKGDVDCDSINAKGAIKIYGTLKGDVSLKLSGNSKIDRIEGGEVLVESGGSGFSIFGFGKSGKLDTESISGNNIYLENTKAKIVTGNEVVIGSGCKVETVKAKSLKVHESASVENKMNLKKIEKR